MYLRSDMILWLRQSGWADSCEFDSPLAGSTDVGVVNMYDNNEYVARRKVKVIANVGRVFCCRPVSICIRMNQKQTI